ncbi:MAG: hypothetical protein KC416_08130, partial [Myxococcales bacterium]|nr:hypothetical protein [Myxococcales bacterium]
MNKVKGLGPLALGAWIGASAIVSGCVGEVGDGVLDPTAMAGLGDDSPYDPADPSAPTGSTPAPADGGVANVPDSGTGTAMNPGADAGADSGTNPPMDPYVPVDDANIIVAVGDRQLRT